jgi:hypothetical protein
MKNLDNKGEVWRENGIVLYSYLRRGEWTRPAAAFSEVQAIDKCWGEILDPTPQRKRPTKRQTRALRANKEVHDE